MEVVAHLRNLRISPRKVRLIADLIRGMKIQDARIQLEFANKKSSEPILKLLNSAIANAMHNFNLEENNLYVSKIMVNEGATLKRWIPRAMGRASAIHKRTSHITIVVEEVEKDVKGKKEIDAKEDKKELVKKKDIKENKKEITGDKKEATIKKVEKEKSKSISNSNNK